MNKVWITILAGLLFFFTGCQNKPPVTASASPTVNADASPSSGGQNEAAQAIRDEVEKRVKESDSVAPDSNGYTLMKDALGQESPDEVKAPYQALDKYADLYEEKGRKAAVEALAKADEDLKSFRTVLPKLEEAADKPHFNWPSEYEKGPAALIPNLIVLRSANRGLLVLGLHEEEQGNFDRAIELYLASARFGGKFTGKHQLIGLMIGLAMERSTEPFLGDLIGSGKLNGEQYKRIIAGLDQVEVNEGDLLRATDGEFAMVMLTMDMIENGDLSEEDVGVGEGIMLKLMIPGERAGYAELYLAHRPDFESLTESFDVEKELEKRKTLILTNIFYPNFNRGIHLNRLVLTNLAAMKVQAALGAYKSEKKEYPESLETLVPDYLEKLPTNYLSGDAAFLYTKSEKDYKLVTQSPDLAKIDIEGDLVHHPRQ